MSDIYLQFLTNAESDFHSFCVPSGSRYAASIPGCRPLYCRPHVPTQIYPLDQSSITVVVLRYVMFNKPNNLLTIDNLN